MNASESFQLCRLQSKCQCYVAELEVASWYNSNRRNYRVEHSKREKKNALGIEHLVQLSAVNATRRTPAIQVASIQTHTTILESILSYERLSAIT